MQVWLGQGCFAMAAVLAANKQAIWAWVGEQQQLMPRFATAASLPCSVTPLRTDRPRWGQWLCGLVWWSLD